MKYREKRGSGEDFTHEVRFEWTEADACELERGDGIVLREALWALFDLSRRYGETEVEGA